MRDPFDEVITICAAFRPLENRLIVLIDPGVVRSNTDAEPMARRIEVLPRERIPRPREDLRPLLVICGEGELILDLKVQLRFTAIVPNPNDDDIVEPIAECSALCFDLRTKLARQSPH